MRERRVQRYPEIFGLGAEGQGFVVEVDFQLTFGFLVFDMDTEDCRHRFRGAELLASKSGGIHLVLPCPCSALFHCQPISISMHDC